MWGVVFLHPALWVGFLPVQHPNQHSFGTKSSRWHPSCTSQEQGQPLLVPITLQVLQLWRFIRVHVPDFKKIDPSNQASTWAGPEWRLSASPCAFWCPCARALWRVRALQRTPWICVAGAKTPGKNAASECHFDLMKPSATSLHISTFWGFDISYHALINNLRLFVICLSSRIIWPSPTIHPSGRIVEARAPYKRAEALQPACGQNSCDPEMVDEVCWGSSSWMCLTRLLLVVIYCNKLPRKITSKVWPVEPPGNMVSLIFFTDDSTYSTDSIVESDWFLLSIRQKVYSSRKGWPSQPPKASPSSKRVRPDSNV